MITAKFSTHQIVEALKVALNSKREELVEEHTRLAADAVRQKLQKYALEIAIELTLNYSEPYPALHISVPMYEPEEKS